MNTVRDGIKTRFNRKSLSFKWIYLEKKGIDDLWKKIEDREPDVHVNNTGIPLFNDFTELTEDLLEKTLAVNLKSVFWMCQHMIKKRKDKGT